MRYCFSSAHHGRGAPDDSQWADDLGRDEEFGIFDQSARLDLSDTKGNLFGLRRAQDGTILDLGTQGQQIAKFWMAPEHSPCHGFPLWSLAPNAAGNRKNQPAPREAITKMEEAGLLSPTQRKRLLKGDRVG